MDVVLGSSLLRTEVFPAMDVAGKECLVIVTKGSWSLPGPGQRPRPIAAQPLFHSDQHFGEPGVSPLRCGADLVRFKPKCDIIFDACAHAPGGIPVSSLLAQARVGEWSKQIRVSGARVWKRVLTRFAASQAEPFVSMPLHLGMAFGGSRIQQADESGVLAETYLANPVGAGWAGPKTIDQMNGQPMPALEHADDIVKRPNGKHIPMALSAIGPQWPERQAFAGTYDDAWRRDVFPFLPEDFDERFHQCAPPDQQVAYLRGGETVQLSHMVAGRAEVTFRLPSLDKLTVRVLRKDFSVDVPEVHADTLFIEPDAKRFSVVWRAHVPLRRRLHEIKTVAIGPVDEAWWRARSLGVDDEGCIGCGSVAGAAR